MRKVCVVVHSRANYGRIKSVLRAVQDHPDLELQLIVDSSALLHRFGQVIDQIDTDGFKADAVVHSVIEGEIPITMAKSTGLAIIELATHFGNLDPDITRDIMVLFRSINLRGTTVIIATHSQELMKDTEQRIILLKEGRMLKER